MFEWFKRKESDIERVAKKDEVALLTKFNEKFKEYKDILTSFSKQDTQTFKDIEEIGKAIEKYLDAVGDIKSLKEYERLIKVYDKKLEKAKDALETLNDIDVTPKKQQKAEQQVAEVLGEEPTSEVVEVKEEVVPAEQDTKEDNKEEGVKEESKEQFQEAASLKEKLLKKNAEADVTIDTDKLKAKPEDIKEKVGEAVESGDPAKIEQVVKETGVEKQSSYNLFLKKCFGSEEISEETNIEMKNILNDSNKSFVEKVNEITDLLA